MLSLISESSPNHQTSDGNELVDDQTKKKVGEEAMARTLYS